MERPLARMLWRRLVEDDPHRFQIVLRPRRVGKTTALYQTVRHLIDKGVPPTRIWWLRLDHPLLMQEDLGSLVRHVLSQTEASPDQPAYLMLDELVYTQSWDLWLKTFFDDGRPVRIAATSSATAALRERRLESGVGRWSEQHLTPFLFDEFLELIGDQVELDAGPTLAETIRSLPAGQRAEPKLETWRRTFMLVGGFPELLTRRVDGEQDEASRLLDSQQALPVAGHSAIVDLGGPFGDVDHPRDPAPALDGAALRDHARHLQPRHAHAARRGGRAHGRDGSRPAVVPRGRR